MSKKFLFYILAIFFTLGVIGVPSSKKVIAESQCKFQSIEGIEFSEKDLAFIEGMSEKEDLFKEFSTLFSIAYTADLIATGLVSNPSAVGNKVALIEILPIKDARSLRNALSQQAINGAIVVTTPDLGDFHRGIVQIKSAVFSRDIQTHIVTAKPNYKAKQFFLSLLNTDCSNTPHNL